MSDSTWKELWQQVAEKKSCEAKQKELTAQRDTLADRLKKLEKSKLAEQADEMCIRDRCIRYAPSAARYHWR